MYGRRPLCKGKTLTFSRNDTGAAMYPASRCSRCGCGPWSGTAICTIHFRAFFPRVAHVWTAPALQGKDSDLFAKRYGCSHVSGLSMQPLWLRALEWYSDLYHSLPRVLSSRGTCMDGARFARERL